MDYFLNRFLVMLTIIGFTFLNPVMSQVGTVVNNSVLQNNWLEMIQDPNVDFRVVQQSFNDYWKDRTDYKGNGWKVFKRWEYINESRVLPDGKLQAPGYVKAEYDRYMHEMDGPNSASGSWTIVGPTAYPSNNTGQPTGLGRVNTIAFHPTDANTIYIGSPSGGFWKTTNGGTSWTNLSNNLATLGVSSILIHPSDPNIIYLGSGDRDASDALPLGVFKSTDGGSTWTQINSTMGNVTVGAMLMHPSDPSTILAATSGGIYKTTNGGSTWSLKATGNFKDIRFKHGDPTIVYAVKITTPSEFHRSTNTGDSWTQVTSGIPTSGIGSRMVIGVSAANANYVYLVQIKSADGNFAGLLRSTDAGLNFSTQSTTPNIFDYACDGSGTSSQATYDLCITVDPGNVNTIYVGSINNWKSTDGGVSWTIVSHWVGSTYGTMCAASIHADQHWYEWSPLNGRLYVGHDGGINYTSDGGSTWPQITNNLAINQIYRIGQGAGNVNYTLTGQQDNGSAATVNGSTFTTTRGGDGTECIIDYSNSNYCYNTYVRGEISRSTTGPTGSYSNIGKSGTNGINETGAWVTPFFLHETVSSTMFAGFRNIWRTTNVNASSASAVSWSAISAGETNTCSVLEQSPVNVDIVYVVRSGSIKRTDNANAAAGSVTWTACTLPGGSTPTDLKAHPTDANIVYATAGYKVYKSSDKGATWSDISANLPELYNNCLVIDKNASEGLYVGNQTGVWFKNSTMTNWALFSQGLPPVDIRELEIYYDATPANNRIKAATYGRGLWQSELMEVNVIDPTNFTANAESSSQIDLAWTRNAANDEVLVVWSPTSTFGAPLDGTAYGTGNTLPSGGGTVIYKGSLTSYNHTSLSTGATYYYKIWSVNVSNQYSAGLPPISATTYSHNWTGGAGTTDWFTPGNWGSSAVPLAIDNVYIPTGLSFYPQINAAGATSTNIKIETGASLSMDGTTAYTLTVAGDWTNNGTFNRGIGTVEFSGTNALQTIKGTSSTAFNILKVTKGAVERILEATSLITLNAATNPMVLTSGTFKLSSASTITPFTSAPSITGGAGLWNNGGTINAGGNFNWLLNGTLGGALLRLTDGTINIGTVAGNYLQYINNPSIQIEGGNLNITGGFRTNATDGSSNCRYIHTGGTVTVSKLGFTSATRPAFDLGVNTTFTMSGGTIIISQKGANTTADVSIVSATSTVTGGTLQIGDATTPVSQTIRINSTAPIYNLVVNSTNSPTAQLVTNGLTVNNDVTISGGTLNANNFNLSVGRNWTNNGTFTPGTGTVTFNGTAAQNIAGSNATTFKGFTMNNSAGASLSGSVNASVDGVLTLTSGVITTGANKLILTSNGSVSRTSGHVNGNLQRTVANGSNLFDIGTTVYAPSTITMSGVSGAVDLTAKTTNGNPAAGSGISQSAKCNHYWTVTKAGTGTFSTYNATFDFTNTTNTGTTASYIVKKYDGSWVSTTSSVAGNMVTATGLAGFSVFEVGAQEYVLLGADDKSSNYSSWSNGSNQGCGYGAWSLTQGGTAGFFLGDPSAAGISGMANPSFGLYANPSGSNYANADRTFVNPLVAGSTLSVDWGVNWDASGSGNKGINLYTGGTGGTQIININMGGSQAITINGNAMFNNYGTQKMILNFKYVSNGQLRVFGTGRDGSEAYDQTLTVSGSPDAIRFYAANLSTGDQRQPYFNNLAITTDHSAIPSNSNVIVKGCAELTGNFTANSLSIETGNSLKVKPSIQLTVNGTLTNNGGVAGLVAESDASGTGSLIHSTSGIDGSVERFVNNSNWNDYQDGWHFLSSPVVSQPISTAFTVSPAEEYDFYAWYESQNLWVNFKNTTVSPTWNEVNGGSAFNVGRGYLVGYKNMATKLFTGTLNTSDVSISGLAISGGGNRSFHLLGNPYASALTWDNTWTRSNIGGVINIWNEAGQGYSPLSADDASPIPSANGFMVQVTGGTGSLTIPASKRVHNGQSWYKNSAYPVLRLVAENLDKPSFQEAQVRFNPMSTNGFDPEFDGNFMVGYAPVFYSLAGTEKLMVNSLPGVSQELTVPFVFERNEGTNFRIVSDLTESMNLVPFLKDKKTGADQNLVLEPVYPFSSFEGDASDRFYIHFKAVGVEEPLPGLEISTWYSDGKFRIESSMDGVCKFSLIDMAGREVLSRENISGNSYSESIVLAKGWYLVRLSCSASTIIRKIVVK